MSRMFPLHTAFVKKYIHDPAKAKIDKLARGNVLDIGCGSRPFYKSIKNQINSYTGIDLINEKDLKKIDVQAVADSLPFRNNSFDFIIFTQVIEHLEEPSQALDEAFRVLRKSGKVILAWPFLFPIHEYPRDFYRYTDMLIKHLANKSGFQVTEIVPVSGFWITFFSFLSIYISRKSKKVYLLLYPFLLGFKFCSIFLEKLDVKSKQKWAWSYYAELTKL